jgi:hypothetical protein
MSDQLTTRNVEARFTPRGSYARRNLVASATGRHRHHEGRSEFSPGAA